MNNFRRSILIVMVVCVFALTLQRSEAQSGTVVRGWVSDSRCASGHVSSGKYTGTNPDCSKECVAKGFKTVLIDPDHKVLLTASNPATTKKNIGDFVEITGDVDLDKKTVRIETLKMLEIGRAMCAVPEKTKQYLNPITNPKILDAPILRW
jgi:hypothetical protein